MEPRGAVSEFGGKEQMLLSVREAGKILGISHHTIRAWIYQRRLPVVRLGRRVLIRREDLEDFIRRNRIPAREEDE